MRTPSRRMPAYQPEAVGLRTTLAGVGVLALFLGGLAYGVWTKPGLLVMLPALAVLFWVSTTLRRRRFRAMAIAREGESLCSFARSFGRREVDTWVVRAVHEQLQEELRCAGGGCPIRGSDRLDKDLRIDSETVEEMLPVIAQRTGRRMDDTWQNPWYDKVHSVADLVRFVDAQPRVGQSG